jgi:IS5 family transposase
LASLSLAIGKMGRIVARVKAAGGATRTRFRDRRRSASRKVRQLASKLHLRGAVNREQAQQTVARVTGELVQLAFGVAT